MNKILTKNIRDFSYEELLSLYDKINDEIERRRRIEKEKAWSEVVDALKNYVTLFGQIECSEDDWTVFIKPYAKYDEIGVIEI